ncbi:MULTISPECIES: helicase C-terminal domain-containing protein [unclassified Streptomyces]|uniref:helicase C-terminal domain-containing protein n=1 Tax=unclassified Streptomyces TaxID=2593676 RepID=UPI001BEAE834|nr:MULTISPECIES: helicase C-terminal domain-containing protein [unclassified Streptomyces]MBT2402699.1 helicase-associated domain-containing protein [Streptomyces sp. ISL-21]MBT2606842.1 helicase-associated domain-containing protein [Streptomyces sp. ISL-87]
MGTGRLTGRRDQEATVPEPSTEPSTRPSTQPSSQPSGGTAPRSLAEALRARDDVALAALLHARPDLLNPVPGDVTQLATRAGTRASVVRALDRLDRFALQTAEALAVAPDPCPYPVLESLLAGENGTTGEDNGARAALPRALATLRDQALVWGDDDRLRLVRTARELLAPSPTRPSPTGLGPTVAEATAGMSPTRVQEIVAAAGLPATHDPVSAVTALTGLFTDPERMSALLDQAPAEAHQVLGRLVWGPPYGEVTPDPAPPVRWLRDRGLLLPATARTVVLPREVALYLRGGLAHRTPEPVAPPVTVHREHRPQLVDANAAGQALAALSTVEELVKSWEHTGPPVLRAGGLAVRDLKRAAATLDTAEGPAAFWIELAYAAGLLASDGEADERYAPTPAFDDWLELPPAERWSALAAAWLPATRTAGLVGEQDSKGRTLPALGPELDRSAAAEVRRRVLELLAALPEGGSPDPDNLLDRLAWERPVRGTSDLRARLAHWTLTEAEVLGVTGRGALSAHGRALLEHRDPAPLLAPLLPEPVDHVLLQADLTAVAPGPLRRPLGDVLAVLAEVESKGGATVYRFTPGSVRRALDAGHTAVDLQAFLTEHSRTPVPQPLSYLIDDVARRHGHLRVGAASSYVRCDDDGMLNEILADKRSAGLGLRRLAPTVLAAQAEPTALLDGLRAMGYAPAAESRTGDVMVTRADAHRTPARSAPEPVPDGPPVPDETLLGAAVRAIRAGDRAATAVRKEPAAPSTGVPGELPRTSAAETLATVQAAALTGSAVWIGYVNADGAASQRVIAPVRVEGGFVTGYDHTADEVRTYALHRITGVAELAEDHV